MIFFLIFKNSSNTCNQTNHYWVNLLNSKIKLWNWDKFIKSKLKKNYETQLPTYLILKFKIEKKSNL
jgi:hypothetical protein